MRTDGPVRGCGTSTCVRCEPCTISSVAHSTSGGRIAGAAVRAREEAPGQAPTAFHVQHALLHVATRTGVRADLTIVRSGYVPRGGGVVRLVLTPPTGGLRALRHEGAGHVVRFWGTSLASHLAERRVAARMAAGARAVLAEAGYDARIDEADDESAAQPGAALARGRSAVRIPGVTEHVESGLRLAREFLGVDARIADDVLMLTGWKADDEQL